MKIDITREPPADIFCHRGRYFLIAGAFLFLSLCGLLLGAYAILSDTQHSENLETVALVLFVGPAVPFFYFGEKVQAYKRLSVAQAKELAELIQQYPEIKSYCAMVAKSGRQPILAEFEACLDRAEEISHTVRPPVCGG
jgi:hypothetical protein